MRSRLALCALPTLNLVLGPRLGQPRCRQQDTRPDQAFPRRQVFGFGHHCTAFKNLAATSTAGVEVSPLSTKVANARSPR